MIFRRKLGSFSNSPRQCQCAFGASQFICRLRSHTWGVYTHTWGRIKCLRNRENFRQSDVYETLAPAVFDYEDSK